MLFIEFELEFELPSNFFMAQELSANYFDSLNQMLKNRARAIPVLLIDQDVLDENIDALRTSLPKGVGFRIVVKSLPSFQLVEYIMTKAETNKLMVFHQPFLSDICKRFDKKLDILLGKPMPVKTAAYFYESLEDGQESRHHIQWLVDTDERLRDYLELAKSLRKKLLINLEIDVGLHRGGFADEVSLSRALKVIQHNKEHLEFGGLMGYDPHVAKLPAIIRSRKKSLGMANAFYHSCKSLIKEKFPELWTPNLTFNGAGSPTLALHKSSDSPLNDISAGSCLVKPTTFDIDTLSEYKAAAFIATPVLKKFSGTTIPGLERWKGILSNLSAANKQSFFIYGGYWKADYCYPPGIKANALFGDSTNQTMLNAPPSAKLDVDDFVFLRPQQSEFVFLQFGKIKVLRNTEIVEEWDLLNNE